MNTNLADMSCDSCVYRTHPLFRHLDEEERQNISLNKITESFKRGSILYREGNRMKGFYCVQSGIIKIFKTGFDGKEQIIRFAKAGDIIGYRSVMSNEPACTTTEVLEEAVVCHIPTRFRLPGNAATHRSPTYHDCARLPGH